MLLYFQLNNPIEARILSLTARRLPKADEGLRKENPPKETLPEGVCLVAMRTASRLSSWFDGALSKRMCVYVQIVLKSRKA